MLELKITGESVEDLFNQSAGVLSLLVSGGKAFAAAQKQAAETPLGSNASNGIVPAPTDPSLPGDDRLVTDTPVEPPTRARGRPRKPAPTDLPKDEIPDLGADEAIAQPEPAKPYTLDGDIRPRIRELMKRKEHELKASLPADQHKNVMAQVTDYMMSELFTPFGIKKASDLPAEKFAEFMGRSEMLR